MNDAAARRFRRAPYDAGQERQEHLLFLPTHLSLLRALHADDATAAGMDSVDSSCPRPSWVEVTNFLALQPSLINRHCKARRIEALLQTVQPPAFSNNNNTTTLDPRSVVSAVFRKALRDREAEQIAASAGLRGLRKGVDATVHHLASSLGDLRSSTSSSRGDIEKPWRRSGEEDDRAAHAADVIERHCNKLILWRRLQEALIASRVGVDERGGC